MSARVRDEGHDEVLRTDCPGYMTWPTDAGTERMEEINMGQSNVFAGDKTLEIRVPTHPESLDRESTSESSL